MNIRKFSIIGPVERASPLIIALIYLVVGSLWVLFTDRIFAGLINDPRTLTTLQTYKGWLYVGITAYLAYVLVSWSKENLRNLLDQMNLKNSRLQEEMDRRIKNERRIEQLMNDLAEKNRELESIIFASSHDLRSPLINIEGFRGELSRSLDHLRALATELPPPDSDEIHKLLDEEIPESMAFIQRGVERLDLLLKGLLTFCRLSSQPMQIETLDVNKLVEHVLEEMRRPIEQAGARVTVEPLLPCRGDWKLLELVFNRLIDNALKFRQLDRPLHVTITSEAQGGRAVYIVSDNGMGIEDRYQHGIFQMYHQLDPSLGGQGLGLTIARRVLTRMNGKISLSSRPGQGSRFLISLPAENQRQK